MSKKGDQNRADKWFKRCESVGCGYSEQEKIGFLTPPPANEKKKKLQDQLAERLPNPPLVDKAFDQFTGYSGSLAKHDPKPKLLISAVTSLRNNPIFIETTKAP